LQTVTQLVDFINLVQNLLDRRKVARLLTNNALEYQAAELDLKLKQVGITKIFTTPYSPQSNVIFERMNQMILSRIRTLLAQADLSPGVWAELAKARAHI
jgi:transposase InsO family protein